jgi:hypothetical protein
MLSTSKEERKRYKDVIEEITDLLLNKFPGDNSRDFSAEDLDYIISSIIWNLFDKKPSHTIGNKLLGVLEGVKYEFYSKKFSPYQNYKKIK